MLYSLFLIFFFFFNDTATTEIYTLSLHDALPISACAVGSWSTIGRFHPSPITSPSSTNTAPRSEEHTSELQSRLHLVCRLLLEKKHQARRRQRHPTTHDNRPK